MKLNTIQNKFRERKLSKKSSGMKTVLCIIQARMGSTRLSGKMLKDMAGKPMLEYVISRAQSSEMVDKVVVCTSVDAQDDALVSVCQSLGVDCFRGSEEDVLDRYYQAAKKYPDFDVIVRVTGDCPLVDPAVIDAVVSAFQSGNYDYVSNVVPPTFPDGMDTEVFSRSILGQAAGEAKLHSEREHVTQYMIKNDHVKKFNVTAPEDYSAYRLTVDNQADFEVVTFIIENSEPNASYLDYIKLLEQHPEVKSKNTYIERNEGLKKSLADDSLTK